MGARDRRWGWVAVAATALFVSGVAKAQSPARGAAKGAKTAAATTPAVNNNDSQIQGKVVRVPVNPTDAVLIINGEVVTRQQLANEAFVREAQKVADAMITKIIIEQELRRRKLEVTPLEVDQEIDRIAQSLAGVSKEKWLETLSKERKISPSQYANDIVFPGLALKKLAAPRVVVTQQDMKDAYDAQFGDKLKCRLIMCSSQRDIVAMWEELKKNPGGFANMAQNDPRSMDQATRSMGGLLEQDLTRHAFPREVSDKAFEQLVDGDPNDSDPAHKPKDGDISGPIQVNEQSWILFKREHVIPARRYDANDKLAETKLREMIFEAKSKEKMTEVMTELYNASAVENKLSGQVKLAHEDQNPDHRVDGDVKLMSDEAAKKNPKIVPVSPDRGTKPGSGSGVTAEDRATRESLKKTIGGIPPR